MFFYVGIEVSTIRSRSYCSIYNGRIGANVYKGNLKRGNEICFGYILVYVYVYIIFNKE